MVGINENFLRALLQCYVLMILYFHGGNYHIWSQQDSSESFAANGNKAAAQGKKFDFEIGDNPVSLILTLNCIRYPALPLVHNIYYLGGGVPWLQTTFPPEFFNYLYTICIYTNHNHISGKKI